MEEVVQFFGEKTFEQVKKQCISEPYNFNVTDDKNLYMVSFTDKSDLNISICRKMTGIILEKDTNKIIHYCFEKAYDGFDENKKDTYFGELPKDYRIEISTEGSLIKTFYYDNEWKFATSRSINAVFSVWGSDKSFKELFLEALGYENLSLDNCDKNFSQTWLLQHPEIKVSQKIQVPFVTIISEMDRKTLECKSTTDGYVVDKKLENILEEIKDIRCKNNYIVYFKNNRVKLECLFYTNIKKLLGNHSSITYSFIQCLKNNLMYEIYSSFPKDTQKFDEIIIKLNEAVDKIHEIYMEFHVRKNKTIDIQVKYLKTIRDLHWEYRRDFNKITKTKVNSYLLKLPIKTIIWIADI